MIYPCRSNRIAVDDAWRNLEGEERTSSQRWKEHLTNKISQAVARELELVESVAMERGHWSQGGGSDVGNVTNVVELLSPQEGEEEIEVLHM